MPGVRARALPGRGMRRPPRNVVLVSTSGRVARLAPVANGSGYSIDDVLALATSAGIDARRARGAVIVGASALPTFEAVARTRRVVLTHRKRATTEEPIRFQPWARPVIDDQAEPVHGCAGAICRTRGCHRARRAS